MMLLFKESIAKERSLASDKLAESDARETMLMKSKGEGSWARELEAKHERRKLKAMMETMIETSFKKFKC